MNQIKGDKLYVRLSASQVRRRLKGLGYGVRKVQSAGRNEAVIIHTATGDHLRELRAILEDIIVSPVDDDKVADVDVNIRPETPTDWEAIRGVNQQAFGQAAEADLVDVLRDNGFVELSLVAARGEQIVGHILFSQIQILSAHRAIPALALAPMSVVPEHQHNGIGSQLVRTGLELCREAGHGIVIVVGHPEFYPRFGFSADLAAPLESEYAGEAFMAAELLAGALNGVRGEVKYSAPFEAV